MVTRDTPDIVGKALDLRSNALAEVDTWLIGLAAVRLTDDECRGFNRRNFTHGWRTYFPTPTGNREVVILIDAQFPYKIPSIFVLEKTLFGVLPHIEQDGYICGISATASNDSKNPINSLKFAMGMARAVLCGEYVNGDIESEFRREFLSYWRASEGTQPIRSVLVPVDCSIEISVWRGKGFNLVGNNQADLENWLKNSRADEKHPKPRFEAGLLIPIDEALVPGNFPKSANDVLKLVAHTDAGAQQQLKTIICDRKSDLIVVFQAATENGVAFFGVELKHTKLQGRGPYKNAIDLVSKGFRPDRVPSKIKQNRLLGGNSTSRLRVDRFDANWVHGRDQVNAVDELAEKNVIILGCGSIGAPVAMQLARSGLGNITLVDPEVFVAANTGRHVLGVSSVGFHKASQLRRLLLDQFPHMKTVKAYDVRIEDLLQKEPNIFDNASVVLSAIGDWATESYLNSKLYTQTSSTAVYAWTEPFAAAGHAAIIREGKGCFACGVDEFGKPEITVSQWPEPQLRQEPACGTMFQPYGAVELGYVHSLVSKAVLDALLRTVTDENNHRVWCGSQEIIEINGGSWTPKWKDLAGIDSTGGFLKEMPWRHNSNCKICGG